MEASPNLANVFQTMEYDDGSHAAQLLVAFKQFSNKEIFIFLQSDWLQEYVAWKERAAKFNSPTQGTIDKAVIVQLKDLLEEVKTAFQTAMQKFPARFNARMSAKEIEAMKYQIQLDASEALENFLMRHPELIDIQFSNMSSIRAELERSHGKCNQMFASNVTPYADELATGSYSATQALINMIDGIWNNPPTYWPADTYGALRLIKAGLQGVANAAEFLDMVPAAKALNDFLDGGDDGIQDLWVAYGQVDDDFMVALAVVANNVANMEWQREPTGIANLRAAAATAFALLPQDL